jgi:hypothetical protein
MVLDYLNTDYGFESHMGHTGMSTFFFIPLLSSAGRGLVIDQSPVLGVLSNV